MFLYIGRSSSHGHPGQQHPKHALGKDSTQYYGTEITYCFDSLETTRYKTL